MKTTTDIRDRIDLSGEEVCGLNFINDSGRFSFRKYYRSGLRSHIFEVLLNSDVDKEVQGVMQNGVLTFPRAVPKKIFRIFRSRFSTADDIFEEIKKYRILLTALGPGLIAPSEEFIVEYKGPYGSHILLCGLQEYIDGEILDPWKINAPDDLAVFISTICQPGDSARKIFGTALDKIRKFAIRIRRMIRTTGYIPDLAGIGNLIFTRTADLKLVDINNIVKLEFDADIHLDDRGYPSGDVSIQVLFMLETNLLGIEPDTDDPLFSRFMAPERVKAVALLERKFYETLRRA